MKTRFIFECHDCGHKNEFEDEEVLEDNKCEHCGNEEGFTIVDVVKVIEIEDKEVTVEELESGKKEIKIT